MPALKVYLSSTLKDLKAERQAIRDALGRKCAVTDSYEARETPVVSSCLADVASCDVFIGIVGLRYGHVQTQGADNPEGLSISELEYRQAGAKPIPRLMFIKHEDTIPITLTDLKTEENPPEKIERFRSDLMNGAEERPAVFSDLPELREAALNAIGPYLAKFERNDGSAHPEAPHRTHEAVRRGYVEWLIEECQKIVLFGLGARDRQGHVRLGQVYVTALAARHGVATKRRPGVRGELPSDGPQHEPLLHRLGRESIYVPGAPGSGKSTFCRWVALSIASGGVPEQTPPAPEEFAESLPEFLHARFPLLCPLREWGASERPWLKGNGQWHRKELEEALCAWVDATRHGELTSTVFREALEQGQCLLILDGVDEIPERIGDHYPRLNFLTGLADALKAWTKAGNRVLLTSRPYGVEAAMPGTIGLSRADLLGLPRELQDVFVRRWYAASGTKDADEKATGLIEHLDGRSDLDDLRPNPMLLTALCVKFDEDMRLPGDLYRLYSAVTDQVLYKRFLTEPERDLARLRLSAVALAMHQGTQKHPRANPAAEVSLDEVDVALSELARTDRTSEQGGIEASEKREQLLSSSGLLLPRADKRAGFYHLSFQEFLAAVRLRRLGDGRDVLERDMATPQWRPTLRFLFCATADQASPEQALSDYSILLQQLDQERLANDPNPALLLADCLEVGHARGWNLQGFASPFRRACDLALEHVEPPARATLWEIRGRIGLDDRPGVGVRDGLPDIDWVEITEGPFQYGEKPQKLELPLFRIARYPVTNAQFQAFVDAGGFDDEGWWRWPEWRRAPERPRWSHPNHPRETVSWFDAMAFCAWLEARLRERGALADGESIRLPSEHEWEKAARGTDGREYPWRGDYESGCANIDETWDKTGPYSLGRTSAVGIYPRGVSRYDVADMAGNVWEWCADSYGPQEERLDASKVVRGGSWDLSRVNARASFRSLNLPLSRDSDVGFRVVRVSPIR